MENNITIKDFKGYKVFSISSCLKLYNGKMVEKTIKKAFPKDDDSTLYVVKLEGIKKYFELYEDEMIK